MLSSTMSFTSRWATCGVHMQLCWWVPQIKSCSWPIGPCTALIEEVLVLVPTALAACGAATECMGLAVNGWVQVGSTLSCTITHSVVELQANHGVTHCLCEPVEPGVQLLRRVCLHNQHPVQRLVQDFLCGVHSTPCCCCCRCAGSTPCSCKRASRGCGQAGDDHLFDALQAASKHTRQECTRSAAATTLFDVCTRDALNENTQSSGSCHADVPES